MGVKYLQKYNTKLIIRPRYSKIQFISGADTALVGFHKVIGSLWKVPDFLEDNFIFFNLEGLHTDSTVIWVILSDKYSLYTVSIRYVWHVLIDAQYPCTSSIPLFGYDWTLNFQAFCTHSTSTKNPICYLK